MTATVLVAVEPESCLAADIVENSAGLAVQGGDADELAQAIARLADDDKQLQKMKENAAGLAEQAFSPEVVLARWASLVRPVDKN